jgi:Nickel/cobalt transporter regulator
MKSLVYTGIAATALAFATTSVGASDSFTATGKNVLSNSVGAKANGVETAPMPPMGGGMPHMGGGMPHMGGGMPHMGGGQMGPRPGMPMNMPHMGGGMPNMGGVQMGPRPGFQGIPHNDVYRRPFRNFILPSYWVQPSFYVNDYRIYGLSAPQNGYYWSRYYDDAVMINQRGNVYDYRPGVQWGQAQNNYPQGNYAPANYAPQGGNYQQAEYGPSMTADRGAYDNDDLAYSSADGSKYGYDGEWNGNYVDSDGRVFEGEWNGTVTRYGDGDTGAYPRGPQRSVGAPYYPQSQPSYAPEQRGYAQCLQSNGLTGAAIGAVLGGVAGNRIAGRGDRLGGSLLGAGLGGLAGVAVEKATKKCRNYAPRGGDYQPQVRYPQQSYPPVYQNNYPQSYPQGYPTQQGGYYYYPQAAPTTTTVTIVPGTVSTTTSTTEEVVYQTYYTTVKRPVHKWKPRPQARVVRCTCR